jgi:hypothetical protein
LASHFFSLATSGGSSSEEFFLIFEELFLRSLLTVFVEATALVALGMTGETWPEPALWPGLF